jgi:hypothetical protein
MNIKKIAEDVAEQEAMLATALTAIAYQYGPFDQEGSGIWVDYEPAAENDEKEIGVMCKNCLLYKGNGSCSVLAQQVEDGGKCRFALIPDGVVTANDDMEENEELEDEKSEDEMNGEMEEESEDEMEDVELTLKPRQQAQYEMYEYIAEKYGKWNQTSGANGAHYASGEANPFKAQGMVCANCIFYEGGRGCEIVSGTIEPEAICKLWIIDESLITE